MNKVNTILMHFLFMLCHSRPSHTDIGLSRVVKLKHFYMLTIPLTCFNYHCTFGLFYSPTHTEHNIEFTHA